MSVILLDPRFPAMIPVEAVSHLRGDVSYTEEVPVRVRWVIADLGGHTVAESDVLVTTDITNDAVRERLENNDELIKAPSLVVEMEPNKQLEAGSGASQDAAAMPSNEAVAAGTATTGPNAPKADSQGEAGAGAPHISSAQVPSSSSDAHEVAHSGAGFVDGEIVGTDEHTVAVAGLRRTTRTEVPASVMDEMEDAVALMARALRQGEWEQAMTHGTLMEFLRQETAELGSVVEAVEEYAAKNEDGKAPQWLEQELCQELSDILLQVLFHAEIANRRGAFDIGHVSGAFVAKMRSRAPYLFEQVERDVPRTEQDRLWAEGKRKERAAKLERLGEPYRTFLKEKDAPAQATPKAQATQAVPNAQTPRAAQPAPTAQPAEPAEPAQPAKPMNGAQPAQSMQAESTVQQAQSARSFVGTQRDAERPQVTSALVEAENVIRRARQLGLPDSKIPTDIRFPMVGLELDEPGESDRRLLDAVRAFHQQMDDKGAN